MKRTIYLLSMIFTVGVAQAGPPDIAFTGANAYFNQVRQKVGVMQFSPHWQSETATDTDSSLVDPFVATTWEFTISYSDDEGDSLVSTYTFDISTTTSEDGIIGLVATDDTGGTWAFWYEDPESSYILATYAGESDMLMYSFNCDTSACDSTVTGDFEMLYSDGSSSEPLEFTGQRIDNSDFVESPSPEELPLLGDTNATDAAGNVVSNQAVFSGGISINGGEYQTQMIQSLYDEVDVVGEMIVDPNHVGEVADIFVYAETTLPPLEEVFYFMLDEGLKAILPWDQNPAHLVAFMPSVRLNAVETVSMYQGTFFYPGTLKVYFGYRLIDGTVVRNGEPIDITIN